MTKLQLRHPRDEAPASRMQLPRSTSVSSGWAKPSRTRDLRSCGGASTLVKQSFFSEVTKLELRDQS
ncbi:hypothetical protein, partial [Thiorhodococcus minor]|uniref:hypothetical protein n=1 Tax=Thiorhodococcus minor TaxID=57489 RepID=UPI001ADB7A8B